jgi:hypothetical protein
VLGEDFHWQPSAGFADILRGIHSSEPSIVISCLDPAISPRVSDATPPVLAAVQEPTPEPAPAPVYFFGCAVGGSSPLRRRYIATEL